MTKPRIIIPATLYCNLREILLADRHRETAAFILAGTGGNGSTKLLYCRRILTVDDSDYRIRTGVHLDIAPRALNGLASLLEKTGLTAVLCHSHVGNHSFLEYSPSDDHGERRVSQFLGHSNSSLPVASILVGESGARGRIWAIPDARSFPADIYSVGEVIRRETPTDSSSRRLLGSTHDRQIKMLGEEGQARIAKATVGVVGLGGTGSSVAEQLARLGVGHLILIDDDYLEPSNISRVYGSYPDQIKNPGFFRRRRRPPKKVDVCADNVRRISPGTSITSMFANVVVSKTATALLKCDVIALCTDEHWGRSLVNQIAYQYLIPTVEVGVRVDARSGKIAHATGSLHLLGPGRPCLWCYDFLRPERIASESMLPRQRIVRLREGYVEGVETAPMVISFTTSMASFAVTEILQLLTGFRGLQNPQSLRYDILESEVRRGRVQMRDTCVCKQVLAFGDQKSLNSFDDAEFVRRCRHGIGPAPSS